MKSITDKENKNLILKVLFSNIKMFISNLKKYPNPVSKDGSLG